MKISTNLSNLEDLKVSSAVIFCYQTDYARDPVLKKLNNIFDGAIQRLYESGEFAGKLNQSVVLHTGSYISTDRVILAGLGKKNKVNDDCFRQASGTISRLKAIKSSESVAFYPNDKTGRKTVSAIIEGFMLGGFVIDEFKSESNKANSVPSSIIICARSKKEANDFDKGIETGKIIAGGVMLARRLAADPGNLLTPQKFASRASSLAKKYKFGCNILDEAKIKAEKMGALLAVGQGSERPPRVVIINYQGGKKGGRPIVLVGKGITFDSGGICLKKALDMDEMKGDMSGGGIVLATVVTAARLGLKQNITGIIPLAENMPSGRAVKPGDIVTSRKGKTIEIINTDAEGRLILADALDYANEFNPKAVIDIATLTGATKYILGYAGIPFLGNNDKLIDLVKAASDRCGELVWPLPIWDEHREMMKSSIADLKNSAGPYSGTITASAFLENFIGQWPWAHIDIACVDIEKKGSPYIPKGQTGVGLRLLVELLSDWKKV